MSCPEDRAISEFHYHAHAQKLSSAAPKRGLAGGPHAGRSAVSGSKEAKEVQKNFKDLRKLGVRNIVQYSATYVFLHRHSLLPYYPPRSEWPTREAKPRFGAALVPPAHDCETRLLKS